MAIGVASSHTQIPTLENTLDQTYANDVNIVLDNIIEHNRISISGKQAALSQIPVIGVEIGV